MVSRKRPGLPENHDLNVDIAGLGQVADIPDFLDMENSRQAAKAKVARLPTQERPPRDPATSNEEQPLSAEPAAGPRLVPKVPEKESSSSGRAQAQKTQAQPTVRPRGRVRPPRKEVGFDDETLAMLKDLHVDGASQSMEESLTRSEVARAALRAIHAARNLVDYSRIAPRGKWGTPTARALVDDLTEAYVRAVGDLCKERYQAESGAR